MRKFSYSLPILLLSLITLPNTLHAATNSSVLEINAYVEPACTVSVEGMSFDVYNPTALSRTTNTLILHCTNGTNYSIGIDNGAAGSTSGRKMIYRNNYLNYSLYHDKAMNMVWNNASPLIGIATGLEQYIVIYGKIPINQRLPAGNYSDNVNISVRFGSLAGDLGYQVSVPMKILSTLQ